jgi:hypothetical protein
MCDERVVDLQSVLQSFARRIPRIILQRAEEMFPALRESLVSVLCMCAQKRMSILIAKEKVLYDILVLLFIICLMTFICGC